MSTVANNRISVTIDPFVHNQVKELFKQLNNMLPFLIGLTPTERMKILKINVANKQFVADALLVTQNNPELFPPYINPGELYKDFTLYNQLDELVILAGQLSEKLRDTQMLAGSEAYETSLVVYQLMGSASRSGIPGTDIIYDQLGERFVGQGPKGTDAITPSDN